MSKKNIVIFAGSQSITDTQREALVTEQLEAFLMANKESINCVLFWGWNYWVMKIVFDLCNKVWITIQWYSLNRYRKENNPVPTTYFEKNSQRIEAFWEHGDVFLTLPWSNGTALETFMILEVLLDLGKVAPVYISLLYKSLFDFIDAQIKEGSMHPDYIQRFKTVEDISVIRV